MNRKTVKVYSPFKVGLVLIAIGSIWIGVMLSGNEKKSYDTNLAVKETVNLGLDLTESGLGFYTITISDYAKQVLFVQVLDPRGNVIADKKIATKMSVNYFEFDYGGKYVIEITNLSEKPVEILVDFGDTRASELIIPSLVIVFGVGFIVFFGYRRLNNQSTAQPEENIP